MRTASSTSKTNLEQDGPADSISPRSALTSTKNPVVKTPIVRSATVMNPGSAKGKSAVSTSYSPEGDGEAFKARLSSCRSESSEEDRESAVPDWWNERYKQDSAYYEEIAIKRAKQRENDTAQWPEKKVEEVQKAEKSESKKRSVIQRSQTIHLVVREHSKKSSLLALPKESGPDFSLSALAEGKWVLSNGEKTGFSVIEKIPVALRKELAKEYRCFTETDKGSHLHADEKKAALRRKLALLFLYQVLAGSGSQIDKEKLESRKAINDYLSKTYGFRIDRSAEKSQSTSSSSKIAEDPGDVISLLVADARNLSKNYRVDYAQNLRNLESDPFVKTTYLSSIENDRKSQKVSENFVSRSDVGGNFQRDFALSIYEAEGADGTVKVLASVDEFVAFIGDPGKARLPLEISFFACQSLGTFVKNTLFTRKNADGSRDSPLKLHDDVPVTISMSPKASYRFKKNADGTILLCYRAEYDSTGTLARSKNSAQVWSLGANGLESKGVVIDGAKATISLDIVFHPNASFEMGTLVLQAEGWNMIDA